MNEKRGVIEQGRTPVETDEKQASGDSLADHLNKRAADVVAEGLVTAGRAEGDAQGLKNVDSK